MLFGSLKDYQNSRPIIEEIQLSFLGIAAFVWFGKERIFNLQTDLVVSKLRHSMRSINIIFSHNIPIFDPINTAGSIGFDPMELVSPLLMKKLHCKIFTVCNTATDMLLMCLTTRSMRPAITTSRDCHSTCSACSYGLRLVCDLQVLYPWRCGLQGHESGFVLLRDKPRKFRLYLKKQRISMRLL